MQLRPEALEGHLAKGLAPLYVITSDEHLLAAGVPPPVGLGAPSQLYSTAKHLRTRGAWADTEEPATPVRSVRLLSRDPARNSFVTPRQHRRNAPLRPWK